MTTAGKKKVLKRLSSALYPLGAAAFIIALWAITAAAVGEELLVPSIGATLRGLGDMLGEKATYAAVGGTIWRALAGWAIALVAAAVFAALAIACKPAKKLFAPFMSVMRSVPTMSVIMLALLWVTSGQMPLVVTFMTLFPVQYSAMIAASEAVDPKLIEMAKIYRVPARTRVFRMYLPCMTPQIVEGVRSTLSLTLKVTIAAEVLAQTRDSIGAGMMQSQSFLQTDRILGWTVIAIVAGALAEAFVTCAAWAARRIYAVCQGA